MNDIARLFIDLQCQALTCFTRLRQATEKRVNLMIWFHMKYRSTTRNKWTASIQGAELTSNFIGTHKKLRKFETRVHRLHT